MTVSYSTDGGVKTATFTGTGALTAATALLSGATVAIIVGYSSIGSYAFRGATGLTSITIPEGVTSIGTNAFREASSLTSITIPASVTSIEYSVFYQATSLTSITVNQPNTQYKDINGVLFNKVGTELIQYPIGNTRTTYAIPNTRTKNGIPISVTSIGSNAFRSASALTSITIPASVTNIGNTAFFNSGLTTIYAYQSLINGMGWSTTDTNTISGKSGITVEPPAPPAAICFPAGTPVTTDQGIIPIERLNPDKHTICGNEIVAITQTRPLQKHIVCFEKDSLSKNVPSQETRCSKEHKVFYKCEMMKARDIVELCENVSFVHYTGETLYNVLLKKQDKMMINNLICETLDPKNIMAKISTMKDGQKKNKAICQLTKIVNENNVPEYQKLYASL